MNCHHANPLVPMYQNPLVPGTKTSGTGSSSIYDTHDTLGELQTYFCCMPVSGTSALQVTWGCTKANWHSRGPGQNLWLWPSSLSRRTAAWWGRITSDLSKWCTREANHLTHTFPLFELPCRCLAHILTLLKQYRTQNVLMWHMQASGDFTVTKNCYKIK